MTFDEVKAVIKAECKKHGIDFYHGKGKTVNFRDGVKSNGYFTDDGGNGRPKIAVGSSENALDVLVHEYCHMQQYLEQSDVWQAIIGRDQIWRWVSGEDGFTEDELDESFKALYLVEVDCEQRSVIQHRKWKTGINEEEYIQKANAYTMFYFFMREHRVWYRSGNEPYNIEEVWRSMPKTFDFDRVECYVNVHPLFELCI